MCVPTERDKEIPRGRVHFGLLNYFMESTISSIRLVLVQTVMIMSLYHTDVLRKCSQQLKERFAKAAGVSDLIALSISRFE